MHITPNITPKYDNSYNQKLNCNCPPKPQQSFTGLSSSYDKFCNGVGKYVCRPIFNNSAIDKIGYWLRNSENAVKHFLAVGSVITSGMYMHQTYTNQKMDKDRRQTLTANQFFTLVLSTAGAYTLDGYVKDWWKGLHEKYIRLNAAGNALWDGMNQKNEEISNKNSKINADITAKVNSGELVPDLKISDDKELFKLANKFIKSDKNNMFTDKLKDIGIEVDGSGDKKALIKKLQQTISNGNSEVIAKLKKAVQSEDYVRKLIEPKISIDDYIDKYGSEHAFDKDVLKKLQVRSKGFSALRSILVFGFVYRFFVPLAVVKPTNWICDKYLENKKAKQAELQKKQQNVVA